MTFIKWQPSIATGDKLSPHKFKTAASTFRTLPIVNRGWWRGDIDRSITICVIHMQQARRFQLYSLLLSTARSVFSLLKRKRTGVIDGFDLLPLIYCYCRQSIGGQSHSHFHFSVIPDLKCSSGVSQTKGS